MYPSHVEFSYALVQDQKVAGTNGGTFTSGSFQTRTLNTVVADPDGIVSLASNQITLQPGTYLIRASAPAWKVDDHQARWRNVTDGTTVLPGTDETCGSTTEVTTSSVVLGRFTITAVKTFELQHRCTTTSSSIGFGRGISFGETNVFASVEIWKQI